MAVRLLALCAGHPLPPRGNSFVLEAESTPRPWCSWKDWVNWKNPMSSLGIEPTTFQLIAQCLSQLHYRVPIVFMSTFKKEDENKRPLTYNPKISGLSGCSIRYCKADYLDNTVTCQTIVGQRDMEWGYKTVRKLSVPCLAVLSQSTLVATQCCSKHLSAVLPSNASVNMAITQQWNEMHFPLSDWGFIRVTGMPWRWGRIPPPWPCES
jgi:hypothetical protein